MIIMIAANRMNPTPQPLVCRPAREYASLLTADPSSITMDDRPHHGTCGGCRHYPFWDELCWRCAAARAPARWGCARTISSTSSKVTPSRAAPSRRAVAAADARRVQLTRQVLRAAGSPHPCGTYGWARPARMLDSTALDRRSLIRMRPLVQVQ